MNKMEKSIEKVALATKGAIESPLELDTQVEEIKVMWKPSGTCDGVYGSYGDVYTDCAHNWGIKRYDILYPRGRDGRGPREFESYTWVDGFREKITTQEHLRLALQEVGHLPREADHEERKARLFPPKLKAPKKVIHRCCIDGCKKAIRPEYSICYPHFDALPRELQQTIRRSYVPESADPQPEAYTEALKQAQQIIVEKQESAP